MTFEPQDRTSWPAAVDAGDIRWRNPLLSAATSVLRLLVDRIEAPAEDVEETRAAFQRGLRRFSQRALHATGDAGVVDIVHYVLCSAVDELMALHFGAGRWSHASLLLLHHKDSSGGQRCFEWLEQWLDTPSAAPPHALELMHVLLALGFSGRYRTSEQGIEHLAALRVRLAHHLDRHPTETRAPASPVLRPRLPVAALAFLFSLVISLLGIGLVMWELRAQWAEAGQKLVQATEGSRSPPAAMAAGSDPFTATTRGWAEVIPTSSGWILRVDGAEAFASGKTRLRADMADRVRRLAAQIAGVARSVTVIAHADSRPPMGVGQGSSDDHNQRLSEQRAEAVAALIRPLLGTIPVTTIGKGARDPISTDRTAQGLARNRRFELLVERRP